MAAVVEEVVFQPKYSWKIWAGFPFFGLAIPICAVEVWSDPLANPMLSFSVATMTLMLIGVSLILIRRIRIAEDRMTIEYYTRSAKSIPFGEIQDIGSTAIRTKESNIVLMSMENCGELLDLVEPRIAHGQLMGEMLEAESYLPLTIIAGVLLWPAIFFLHTWIGVPTKWIELLTLGIWAITVWLISLAVRKYYQKRYA